MVDVAALQAANGLVRGQFDGVVVLGSGELTSKVTVKVDRVTAGARATIEKAGGSVELRPGAGQTMHQKAKAAKRPPSPRPRRPRPRRRQRKVPTMASGLTNIFRIPELRKRLLFSLGMLAVYRLGIFVTTPGWTASAMGEIVRQGSLLGLLNFFSGGALEQLSIFALGIMPYVSASIILQLLTVVIPTLEKLQKEGELGRRKITQYTRYGTIVLSAIQGYGIATYLESLRDQRPALVGGRPSRAGASAC